MKHSIRTLEEAKIFVQGATLLGTGGGGFPQEGLRVLTEALEKKGIIQWNDVEQVRDDATAICVFLMGSTAPMTPEKEEEMKRIGLDHRRYPTNMINAISEWEQYTGKTADIIVPLEVGGSNLCAPLAVATMMGKTIVDGDYAGRAIPEIFQISLQKENVDLCPAVSFDKFGNISIMKSAINLPVAERMGKMLSEVAFGSTAIAGFPISGAQLKRLLVRGSVSLSYAVGELIEDAKITGKALETNLKRAGMKKIFEGVCVKKDWKDEGGYYSGTHFLQGCGDYAGKALEMYFKNENHIVWIDGEYAVSSPDLICTIDPDTLAPLRTDDVEEGTGMEVYQKPCNPILRDKEIRKYMEPRYFGFDIEYREIEQPTPEKGEER